MHVEINTTCTENAKSGTFKYSSLVDLSPLHGLKKKKTPLSNYRRRFPRKTDIYTIGLFFLKKTKTFNLL